MNQAEIAGRACLLLVAIMLASCGPDPYDPAKMDLKPAPAKVTAERHKGAFAEGTRSAREPS